MGAVAALRLQRDPNGGRRLPKTTPGLLFHHLVGAGAPLQTQPTLQAPTIAANTDTAAVPTYGSTDVRTIVAALTYWIPNETIAVYAVVISFFGTNLWSSSGGCHSKSVAQTVASPDFWLGFFIVLFAITSPIIVYLTTRNKALANGQIFKTPIFEMIASVVAFVAWANYLPNSVVAHCLALSPLVTVSPVIAIQVILYVAGEMFGLNPPAPFVSEDEREGIVFPPTPTSAQPVSVGAPLDGQGPPPLRVAPSGPRIRVMAAPDIIPVFMGSWNTPDTMQHRANCLAFLDTLLASDTYKVLTSDYGVNAANRLPDKDLPLPSLLNGVCTDDNVAQNLQALSATLSVTRNSTFVVFCPQNVNVSFQSGQRQTCLTDCGFHETFYAPPGTPGAPFEVPYAVIAYADGGCNGCATTRRFPVSVYSIVTHEVCEMLTNPYPYDNPSGGYVASDGREIADDCQGAANTLVGTFGVQQIWSNSCNKCV
jgi:hypothetical protein